MPYSSELKEKETCSKETERSTFDPMYQRIIQGDADVSPSDEGGGPSARSDNDRLFTFITEERLQEAQEFRLKGYNSQVPEVDPELMTHLREALVATKSRLCIQARVGGPLGSLWLLEQVDKITRLTDRLSDGVIKSWIEHELPGKNGGEAVDTELGSRRTAQSLARRLESTLQTLIRVVHTLRAIDDYSTPEKRHDMLVAELTGAFSFDDKSTVIQALGRITAETSGYAAWASLMQIRAAEWGAGMPPTLNVMIETSRHEAEKANKKARELRGPSQAFFSDVAAYLQNLSSDLAKASINASKNASSAAIPLVKNEESAAPLLRSNSLTRQFKADIKKKKLKIQTAVTGIKGHVYRLARITQHGHSTGTPTKDPEHVVADSIIRSILWQWQQPAIKIQHASSALLSKVDELIKIKGILASHAVTDGHGSEEEVRNITVGHPGEDDMDAQVREWVNYSIEQEKPENQLAAKVTTLEQLLHGDVASARNLVTRLGKTEENIQNMLRRQRFAVLKMIVKRFIAIDPALVVDKLLPDITRNLTASIVALDKALQVAESPTRGFAEAKEQAGYAQLLATKVKESLSAESARLTGRPIDEHSRGSRLAKHWANLAKTQSMGNYPPPDAEQVLSSLQERGLLAGTLSTGDPAGYLFATRLAGELENARNDELRLPMSPLQYTALEKGLVEYIVKWGQKRTSRGLSRIVIELSFEQALDTVTFNVSSLFRLPYKVLKASIKIPYNVNKVNNYTMPGYDKPYKAIYGLLEKKLKQLGFNLLTAPVPGVIKLAAGAGVTAGAALHNLYVGSGDKTFSAVYQHVAEGKKSEKIKMNSVYEMIFDSVLDTTTTAAFKGAGRAWKSARSEKKVIPESRQLTGEDRNLAETEEVKLSLGATPSIIESSVASTNTANDSENSHDAANINYKKRVKREVSYGRDRSSYILHDDSVEISTNEADNLIVPLSTSEILYTTELSKDEVVKYNDLITNEFKVKAEQHPLSMLLNELNGNKKQLEEWLSREQSARQEFEKKLESKGYKLINGEYQREYDYWTRFACDYTAADSYHHYSISANAGVNFYNTGYSAHVECPPVDYLDDAQKSVIHDRKLRIDDIKVELDDVNRKIVELKSIINGKSSPYLKAIIQNTDEKINSAEDSLKIINDEIRNISAESILLDPESEDYELKIKKIRFIKHHLLLRKSLAYRHAGAIESLKDYKVDKFPERCNSYQDIVNSHAKAAEIYCKSQGIEQDNIEEGYAKEYENILSRGGGNAKSVEYMNMLIFWAISHEVKDFDNVSPLEVFLNYTKMKREYYKRLYFFDNIQPENYRHMNELRSDFEFNSRSDYTKQYNDYIDNGSSEYDAKNLTPSVIFSLELSEDELTHPPEEVSIYRAAGMYSGSTTLIDFNVSVVTLSSGRAIVFIYDYDGVRKEIIPKEDVEKLKQNTFFYTRSFEPSYPYYTQIHKNNPMISYMNLVEKIKPGSVKEAVYESLKSNINQFMRRRMIEAEHHGVPHDLAVSFVPFYGEIYNSATDSHYVVNGEKIILDINNIILSLAGMGVNFSKLSTKSLKNIVRILGKKTALSTDDILMEVINESPEVKGLIANETVHVLELEVNDVIRPSPVSFSRDANYAKNIKVPTGDGISDNIASQIINDGSIDARIKNVLNTEITVAEIHPVPEKINNIEMQSSGVASPSGGITKTGTDLNYAKKMIEKSTQIIINNAESGTERLKHVKPSKMAEAVNSIEFTNKKLKDYAAHAVVVSDIPELNMVLYKRRFLNLPGHLSPKNTFPGIELTDGINGEKYRVVDKSLFMESIENSYNSKTGNDNFPLHPEIKARIEKHLENNNCVLSRKDGIPGLHAEVQALNFVYHKLDSLNLDNQLGLAKTYIYTKRLVGEKNADFAACVNCSGILVGPENIMTGRID